MSELSIEAPCKKKKKKNSNALWHKTEDGSLVIIDCGRWEVVRCKWSISFKAPLILWLGLAIISRGAGWDPDHTRYEKGLWMESPDSTVDNEWSDSGW